MFYTAKNTRFNREATLLDKTIYLFEKKNGLAYFAFAGNDLKYTFCVCEESLFDKEFFLEADNGDSLQIENLKAFDLTKLVFKKYPAGIKIR